MINITKNILKGNIIYSNILKRTHLHIKNMVTENVRAELQKEYDESKTVIENNRIYKPTYTIPFNRVGEVLLYSCDPIKHMTIYFKYPYIFYESFIPMSIFLFFTNPLNLDWNLNYLNLFVPFIGIIISLVAKGLVL